MLLPLGNMWGQLNFIFFSYRQNTIVVPLSYNSPMPHLLAAISAHGYGHLAQTAPVLNALREAVPDLQLTVRCDLPREVLEQRIAGPFVHQPVADDFGMVMHNALAVDVKASAARYAAFHADWEPRVDRAARELEQTAPDLVLADTPYLTLAAAARAGIPAVAMCCLNWADIYDYYTHDLPEARTIHEQMLSAYNSAAVFLRATPAMPMPALDNRHDIGPLALVGTSRRDAINAQCGLDAAERLVVVVMGGITFRPPMEQWPELPGVRFVMQRDWHVRRSDTLILEEMGMPFADVLASCDAVITKPGYGTFAEAACAGVPVLYVPRINWPEEPWLVSWLETQIPCEALPRTELEEGTFLPHLQRLWQTPRPEPRAATGVAHAVALLKAHLV